MELAEGRDVVEAGIGTGIRDHHETVPHQNSATIGHSKSPSRPTSGGQLVANFRGASNPNSRGAACAGQLKPDRGGWEDAKISSPAPCLFRPLVEVGGFRDVSKENDA